MYLFFIKDEDSSKSTPITSSESSPKPLRKPISRPEEIQLVNMPVRKSNVSKALYLLY